MPGKPKWFNEFEKQIVQKLDALQGEMTALQGEMTGLKTSLETKITGLESRIEQIERGQNKPQHSHLSQSAGCSSSTMVAGGGEASTSVNSKGPQKLSTILLKKKQPRPLSSIDITSETFEQFLRSTNVLADRSLFIQDLFKCPKRVIICLPPGVGKTMALTMAQLFLQNTPGVKRQEDSKAYTLFNQGFDQNKRFKIMDDQKFVKEHFGQYNVIYISLGDIKYGMNIEEDLSMKLAHMIRSKSDQLQLYITKILDENPTKTNAKNKKMVQYQELLDHSNMMVPGFNSKYWNRVVRGFVNLLYDHNGKKCIIMIDDFDSPIVNNTNFNSSDKWAHVGDAIKMFINAFKMPFEKYVKLLLLAGSYYFPLGEDDDFEYHGVDSNRRVEQSKTRRRWKSLIDLTKYFGFEQSEFDELCKSAEFPENLKEKARMYLNGYAISSSRSLYNTWATISLMNKPREWRHNWQIEYKSSPFIKAMKPLFRKKPYVEIILPLIKGENVSTAGWDWEAIFTEEKVNTLRQHAKKASVTSDMVTEEVRRLFLNFLLSSGFLTLFGSELSIPNEGIRDKLKQHLIDDYYQPMYKFTMDDLDNMTCCLSKIVKERDADADNIKELENAYVQMLDSLEKDGSEVGHNEDLIHVVLDIAAMRLHGWKFFATDCKNKIGTRPDIYLYNEMHKTILCFELKWEKSNNPKWTTLGGNIETAFKQIHDQQYLTKMHEIPSIDYIFAFGVVGWCQLQDKKKIRKGKAGSADRNGNNNIRIICKHRMRKSKENFIDFLSSFQEKLGAYKLKTPLHQTTRKN